VLDNYIGVRQPGREALRRRIVATSQTSYAMPTYGARRI
jgi:hypothetical protein